MHGRVESITQGHLYLPALDGLRFLAFLLVCLHHLPALPGIPVLSVLQAYGWIGVELFFVISAFLFFHLFEAEHAKTGAIDVGQFFIRRVLRIYPLMIGFPLIMCWMFRDATTDTWLRIAAIALNVENLVNWFKGYDMAVRFAAHLWTLSFEFQVYLAIPVAFLALRKYGRTKFLIGLGAVFLFCLGMRLVFVGLDAPHPIVWVTPFLRPESVLIGIALSVGVFARVPPWGSALMLVASVAVFLSTMIPVVPWRFMGGAVFAFPLIALMGVSLVNLALTWRPLSAVLAFGPIRYLGKISYGLYVYHMVCIYGAQITFAKLGILPHKFETPGLLLLFYVTTVAISALAATASYYILERPFLILKKQFAVVDGRSVLRNPVIA